MALIAGERLKVGRMTPSRKLESIEEADVRMFCLSMLRSGVRIDEAYKINHETNTVIGKGERTEGLDLPIKRFLLLQAPSACF